MKIIALCKTFRGEEWLRPMVLSIYPYVDKIVFVNSETSWTGRKGNTCKEVIEGMRGAIKRIDKKEENRRRRLNLPLPDYNAPVIDNGGKIISIDFDTTDQQQQVMVGWNYIKENFKNQCDYVMFIDTDEVWDTTSITNAIATIKKSAKKVWRAKMYTYIKSPYWRVDPVEPLRPVVFVPFIVDDLGKDARACGLEGYGVLPQAYIHHFVYVRWTFNAVLEKIIDSHVSENMPYEDMSVWIPEVWNKLPEIKDPQGFHPAIGFRGNWKTLIKVRKCELPEVFSDYNFGIMEGAH